MKKRRSGTCTYCGIEGKVTREHVIPRCLFEPVPEVGLILVPVCRGCNNNEKAKLDEYFRDRLIFDTLVKDHPTVRRFRAGAYRRAVDRNHSKLTRIATVIATTRGVTYDDVYRGNYNVVFANEDRLKREIDFINRGLGFDYNPERADDSKYIDILPIKLFASADALLHLHRISGLAKTFEVDKGSECMAFHSKNSSEGIH